MSQPLQTYITPEPELRLDQIAQDIYGSAVEPGSTDSHPTVGTVEALLDTNPGLADYGWTIPSGITLSVPVAPEPPEEDKVRPWL